MIRKALHKRLLRTFSLWFPLALALSSCIFFVYAGVQFTLRTIANDPQIQLVDDTVRYLRGGMDPKLFGTQRGVDIESGMSPYVVIYNAAREPVAGNGMLYGVLPSLPRGVYEHAKRVGEHRFTWRPAKGIRQSIVLRFYRVPASGVTGFVLSGRSLLETEGRIERFGHVAALFWFFSVLTAVAAVTYLNRKN